MKEEFSKRYARVRLWKNLWVDWSIRTRKIHYKVMSCEELLITIEQVTWKTREILVENVLYQKLHVRRIPENKLTSGKNFRKPYPQNNLSSTRFIGNEGWTSRNAHPRAPRTGIKIHILRDVVAGWTFILGSSGSVSFVSVVNDICLVITSHY